MSDTRSLQQQQDDAYAAVSAVLDEFFHTTPDEDPLCRATAASDGAYMTLRTLVGAAIHAGAQQPPPAPDTAFVPAAGLLPGMSLVGSQGGISKIEDTEPSSVMPGSTLAYTEHGGLYLEDSLVVEVLADDFQPVHATVRALAIERGLMENPVLVAFFEQMTDWPESWGMPASTLGGWTDAATIWLDHDRTIPRTAFGWDEADPFDLVNVWPVEVSEGDVVAARALFQAAEAMWLVNNPG